MTKTFQRKAGGNFYKPHIKLCLAERFQRVVKRFKQIALLNNISGIAKSTTFAAEWTDNKKFSTQH